MVHPWHPMQPSNDHMTHHVMVHNPTTPFPPLTHPLCLGDGVVNIDDDDAVIVPPREQPRARHHRLHGSRSRCARPAAAAPRAQQHPASTRRPRRGTCARGGGVRWPSPYPVPESSQLTAAADSLGCWCRRATAGRRDSRMALSQCRVARLWFHPHPRLSCPARHVLFAPSTFSLPRPALPRLSGVACPPRAHQHQSLCLSQARAHSESLSRTHS